MNSQYPVLSDIGPGPLPGMHNEQYLLLLDSATVRHLYGYHGTGRIHGLRILQEGFEPSTGDQQWLGTGIYFWELEPVAHWWGKKGLRQQRWQDYVILGADISVDEDRLLDLDTDEGNKLYHDLCRAIEDKRVPDFNPPSITEGVVLDLLCSVISDPPIDVVVADMPAKRLLYEWQTNITRRRIMICVRNPECIEGLVVVYDSLKNGGVQGEKSHEQHSKAQKADG